MHSDALPMYRRTPWSWNLQENSSASPRQKRIRVYERVEFPDFFISSGEANHPLAEEEVPRPLNRDIQLDG